MTATLPYRLAFATGLLLRLHRVAAGKAVALDRGMRRASWYDGEETPAFHFSPSP